MLNPANGFNPGSYSEMRKRLLQRLSTAQISGQVLALVENAFETALWTEQVVLSRVEKKRLLRDVTKSILEELNQGFEKE